MEVHKLAQILALIILFFAAVTTQAQQVETVVVEGVGISIESASKNAGKAAVRQVVGMYVVTDAATENRELIKDEVLTNSNGYIKSFKILDQSSEDGMFTVEAEVEVEIGKLVSRLGKLNIATKEIATTEYKVKVDSAFSATENFAEMIDKVIFTPLEEGASVYDIQIDEFTLYKESLAYNTPFGQALSSHAYSSVKGLESGQLLPFLLTFYMGFNSEYISSIKQFMDASSETKTGYKNGWRGNQPTYTFEIVETSLGNDYTAEKQADPQPKYKGVSYTFSEINRRIMKSKYNDFSRRDSNLIISFTDVNDAEVAIISLDARATNKGLVYGESSVPNSALLAEIAKDRWNGDARSFPHILYRGILYTGDQWGTEAYPLLVNKVKLGIIVLLAKEEAAQIEKIKIDMRWPEKPKW